MCLVVTILYSIYFIKHYFINDYYEFRIWKKVYCPECDDISIDADNHFQNEDKSLHYKNNKNNLEKFEIIILI